MRLVLATILDRKPTAAAAYFISMLREFLDAFPEELRGMPLIRTLEFTIELHPGISPIFTPPYQMVPAKLDDLDRQIQELLRLGFIRTSRSPWVSSTLYANKKDRSL